jgi:hypothetical protein
MVLLLLEEAGMKFDRKMQFVSRVRTRARRRGCQQCHRITEVGIMGPETLNAMMRRGAPVAELKAAIREKGWYCRKCVRKSKGTSAATSLRDQFPPGPDGTRRFYQHCWDTVDKAKFEERGWGVKWHEDGSYSPTL